MVLDDINWMIRVMWLYLGQPNRTHEAFSLFFSFYANIKNETNKKNPKLLHKYKMILHVSRDSFLNFK